MSEGAIDMTDQKKNAWGRREELLNRSDELTLKADLLAFESRYEEAITYYDRALEINPRNPHLWAFKGITLKGGLNRDEEARACWDRAKALDPELAEAVSSIGPVEEPKEKSEEPALCSMSETTRQKILKLMRDQVEKDRC